MGTDNVRCVGAQRPRMSQRMCGVANGGAQVGLYGGEQGYSSRAPSLKEEAFTLNLREFPV